MDFLSPLGTKPSKKEYIMETMPISRFKKQIYWVSLERLRRILDRYFVKGIDFENVHTLHQTKTMINVESIPKIKAKVKQLKGKSITWSKG